MILSNLVIVGVCCIVPFVATAATNAAIVSEVKKFRSSAIGAKFADLERTFRPPQFESARAVGSLDDVQFGDCVSMADAERTALLRDGVLTSESHTHMTFFSAYLNIFQNDLPVYITADAILHPLHRSYDAMLMTVEQRQLIADLTALLASTHAKLATLYANDSSMASVRADVDVYIAVARALLNATSTVELVAGGNRTVAQAMIAGALGATGPLQLTLFGDQKLLDFSTFKPRGHYVGNDVLEAYFRAMMWLGRVEFRLTAANSDPITPTIDRETLGAMLLGELVRDAPQLASIDSVLTAIVGESDNANALQLNAVMSRAGVTSARDCAASPALLASFRAKLRESDVGVQQILSQLVDLPSSGEIEPPRAFLLLGQRFTFDSNLLGSVVQQNGGEKPSRLMPNEKDVLYGVLSNDVVLPELKSDVDKFGAYAERLLVARHIIEQTPASVWTNSSLYNAWLGALRQLSPPSDAAEFAKLPRKSAAYWRAKANAQLASYAALRRNNILYVKESNTGILGCDFPAVYVEPIPAFWRAIVAYARHGMEVISPLTPNVYELKSHFNLLHTVAQRLEKIATAHVDGAAVTEDDIKWVNQMCVQKLLDGGCVAIEDNGGWFYELYMARDALEADKVVSSIHTQPSDEEGSLVGRVLHFGTDNVETTLLIADDCSSQPTLFVGASQSFKSLITTNFERLNDEEWQNGRVRNAVRPSYFDYFNGTKKFWSKKCESNNWSNKSIASTLTINVNLAIMIVLSLMLMNVN